MSNQENGAHGRLRSTAAYSSQAAAYPMYTHRPSRNGGNVQPNHTLVDQATNAYTAAVRLGGKPTDLGVNAAKLACAWASAR